ncbi:hypothetical protein N7519_008657 [Penicillium mononematosum]|uniref:uncharacterized protein n=1 Tax=Penicillium mononematosum TaxID=268346 RepID=UPI0025481BAD|nr:uncharacterized protein N7519_008657 [Penicillium mononematosum]KAJ6178196.1 hypothetical protein N7519_008657 [Penicillium mononematosum]
MDKAKATLLTELTKRSPVLSLDTPNEIMMKRILLALELVRRLTKGFPGLDDSTQNKSDRPILPVSTGAANPHLKSAVAQGHNFTVVGVRDNQKIPSPGFAGSLFCIRRRSISEPLESRL